MQKKDHCHIILMNFPKRGDKRKNHLLTLSYICDKREIILKALRVNKQVKKELDDIDPFTKKRLAELFSLLMEGVNIGLPISRPMPSIAHGAHELRLKSRFGQYRVFYFLKTNDLVIVFHFLKKKTQKTPHHEIAIARKRLEEML